MTDLLKKNGLLLKVLFSASLLAVLAFRTDYKAIQAMVEHIHFSTCVFAMMFIFFQIIALSYRWMLLVNAEEWRMGLSTSLRITLVSFLANYLFITSAGGIIARIGLSMHHGISLIKSIAITFIDRMMTLLALCLLAAVFLPTIKSIYDPHLFNASVILILMSISTIAAFLIFLAYRNRRSLIFMNRKIALGFKYLRTLATDRKLLTKVVLVSIVAQIMYFIAVYIVMKSLGAEFSFFKFMIVMPFITIVASLPVGYGGWGIREGAFIYGLGLINMPIEAAFMASVQIGIISMLAAMIAGIPAFLSGETQFALKSWKKGKTCPSSPPNP